MKKFLFLLWLVPSICHAGFRSDYLTATSSFTSNGPAIIKSSTSIHGTLGVSGDPSIEHNITGLGGFACGAFNQCSGSYCFASGETTASTGYASASFGTDTVATGDNSFVGGAASIANGYSSFVFGSDSLANSSFDFAFGSFAEATGGLSLAWGSSINSRAQNSISFGKNFNNNAPDSFKVGFDSPPTWTVYKDSAVVNGTLHTTEPISSLYGGTSTGTYIQGDILYASSSDTLSKLPIGTTNQVLGYSTTTANISWIEPSKDYNWFRNVGTSPLERWYGNLHIQTNSNAASIISSATLYGFPFLTGRGGTIDRIAFNVTITGASGAKARACIYSSTSETNIYPADLILDGGEFDTSTSTGVKAATISTALPPNQLVWLSLMSGSTATVRAGQTTSMPNLLGIDATMTSNASGITVARNYGSCPTTFPSSPTMITTPNPYIAVRYSQ